MERQLVNGQIDKLHIGLVLGDKKGSLWDKHMQGGRLFHQGRTVWGDEIGIESWRMRRVWKQIKEDG